MLLPVIGAILSAGCFPPGLPTPPFTAVSQSVSLFGSADGAALYRHEQFAECHQVLSFLGPYPEPAECASLMGGQDVRTLRRLDTETLTRIDLTADASIYDQPVSDGVRLADYGLVADAFFIFNAETSAEAMIPVGADAEPLFLVKVSDSFLVYDAVDNPDAGLVVRSLDTGAIVRTIPWQLSRVGLDGGLIALFAPAGDGRVDVIAIDLETDVQRTLAAGVPDAETAMAAVVRGRQVIWSQYEAGDTHLRVFAHDFDANSTQQVFERSDGGSRFVSQLRDADGTRLLIARFDTGRTRFEIVPFGGSAQTLFDTASHSGDRFYNGDILRFAGQRVLYGDPFTGEWVLVDPSGAEVGRFNPYD